MSATRSRIAVLALLAAMVAAAIPVTPVLASGPDSSWYLEDQLPVTSDASTFYTSTPTPGTHFFSVSASFYSVYLDGVDDTVLTPGVYSDAIYPSVAGHASIDTPLGCGDQAGSFTVYEIAFAPDGTLLKLAIDYNAHCTGSWANQIQGALRFHSSYPVKAVSLVKGSIDLGDVATNQTAGDTVTVKNIGTGPVQVDHGGIIGPGSAAWSITSDGCAGVTLAVDATCSFDVQVAPTTFGELPGNAIVVSDAFAPTTMGTQLHAYGLIATTIAITTSVPRPVAGQEFQMHVTTSPVVDEGIVDLWLDDGYLGRLNYYNASDQWVWILDGVTAGVEHHAHAEFYSMSHHATAAVADLRFTPADVTATTVSVNRWRTYADDPATITATVTTPAGVTGGTLTISDNTTSTLLGSVAITPTVHSLVIKPSIPAGDHWIVAEYSGSAAYGTSIAGVSLRVLPDDGVALIARTPSAQTLYPYKDGYVDTVRIGGTLDELANATIRIYRPTGGLVVTKALGWTRGKYGYAWSGRTSTGTAVPPGKYKAVQTLKDRTGHVLVVTSYVTVSSKRLYTYSTYLNRTVSQASKKTSWWIGWQFTLPSATVYKQLTFQAYGQSRSIPGLDLGGVDFRTCPLGSSWGPSCVTSWGGLGWDVGWSSKGLSPTFNRSGRYVRGVVWAEGSGIVYKSRLKVVYGILR